MVTRPILLATAIWLSLPAQAATTEIGPSDDPEAAIARLGPGDELVLRGGTYEVSGRFTINLAGTAASPIVIRAKDGEHPHIHRAGVDQNLIDLDRANYVVIRGIELSGGSAGLRISAAQSLTIEDCEIHGTDDVAVRANDSGVTYESLRILRNHIHHTSGTGEGMYLGCNNNACRVANSLIEGNWIHDTKGPNVSQGDGIEVKEGGYGNIIRDNVIHDTGYPCIITYSASGNGGPNIIERNLMWNCGDHGIQSAADAVIKNNIILSAASDGIAMQPHQAGSPSNLVVVHNTVLKATGDAISLRGTTGTVLIANNAVYAAAGRGIFVSGGNLAGLTVAGNVGTGGLSGTAGTLTAGDLGADFVAASLSGAPPNDVFPKAAGALAGAGASAHVVSDDFNGTARGGVADVGAYKVAGANPGWTLQDSFKGAIAPAVDAGVSAGADSGVTPVDTGVQAPADAGATADGGVSADAGVVAGADSGVAGARADAGGSPGAPTNKGCGCDSGTSRAVPGALALLLVMGLWQLGRRRGAPKP